MKKIFVILLAVSTFSVFAQNGEVNSLPTFQINDETKMVEYTGVIQVPGVSKDSLYDIADKWIINYFKSSSSIMKVEDKEQGVMEGRHGFYLLKKVKDLDVKSDFVGYTFNIQFRDERYKYAVTKINIRKASYYGVENWLEDDDLKNDPQTILYLHQIDKAMKDFVEEMKAGIQPEKPKVEKDW